MFDISIDEAMKIAQGRERGSMTREQAEKEIRDTFTEVWADGIIKALEQEPTTNSNIPFLMHKEMDIPISECQKAYDIAMEYLRSRAKVKG